MNAPPSAPRRMRSSPTSSSDRYASRTETRLVLNCRAMSRSAGSLCPTARRPSEICFLIRRAMTSDTRPGRPELLSIDAIVALENELYAQLNLPGRRGRGSDLAGQRVPDPARVEDEEVRQPEV